MSRGTWHILTGEYPPRPGGVGDYSALLAAGLAARGLEVDVWTASDGLASAPVPVGVTVHRECGAWRPADLARLGASLDAFPTPRRLLVQHAPNAWGYKGLNFGFCRWLGGRRRDRGDETRVMFHEVAFPFEPLGKPTRWVLAAGQRLMARMLMDASAHVDVSTSAWTPTLRRCAPGVRREFGWRPVSSNIPVVDDPSAVEAVRRRFAPGGEAIVGSFGSFTERVGAMLDGLVPRLLAGRPDCVGLLIGRTGERLAAKLVADHPGLAGRLAATGGLPPAEASLHLQACDLVVQPFPEGVTTRRTSLMAALAHGVPTVTNSGRITEPFWAGSGGVALAPGPAEADLVDAAWRVLDDARGRARLGAAGRALYEARFAMERTVEAIVAASREQVNA